MGFSFMAGPAVQIQSGVVPVADPVPPPETATETPPVQEEQVESAAPPVEEAAVVEAKPDYVTREELDAIRQQERATARVEAENNIRIESQRRNRLLAQEQEREAEAVAAAKREAKMALFDQGIQVDESAVAPVFEAYTKARTRTIRNAELKSVQDGITLATAEVLKAPPPDNIDQSDDVLAKTEALRPYVEQMADRLRESARAELLKDYVSRSELPQLVEAEIKRRGLEARESAQDFGVDGQPATSTNDLTPERYAAMDASARRKLQTTPEGRAQIDAMTRKYVRVPERA